MAQVRIIATGGHSGLGAEAIKALLHSPALVHGAHLELLARQERIEKAKRFQDDPFKSRPTSASAPPEMSMFFRDMDMTDLMSVRKAAQHVKELLQSTPKAPNAKALDILLLNAALAKSQRQTVVDGGKSKGVHAYPSDHLIGDDDRVDTTACANHVAHLLLVSMLIPHIARNALNGRRTRIVFTGSALHRSIKDAAILDDYFAAASQTSTKPWTLRETYAASKFLQMLGVRALCRRIEATLSAMSVPPGMVEVVVVQPGFVPQTGLTRESGFVTRMAMAYLMPWAPFATTLEDAGRYIANACTVDLSSFNTTDDDHTEQQDGFGAKDRLVRSALLEVRNKQQQFGTLDPRTADVDLQEKWWPDACNHVLNRPEEES